MQKKYYKIAIDGPAGSGKSTIAKLIAQELSFLYIDSGAMYRAITFFLLKKKLLDKSEKELIKYIKKLNIEFKQIKENQLVFLNRQNITNQIRTTAINNLVSKVSSKKVVRTAMVKKQKLYGLKNSIIMDGRDIGTTVFKDADLKIYLTASPKVRARRRLKDLNKLKEQHSIKELIKQIQYRDNYDSSRTISPLCKSQDAVVIDSSNLNIKNVVQRIVTLMPILKSKLTI